MASKEMVKPSSATPPHLRNLKLSFLDRRIPLMYIPMIFFYKSDHKLQHPQVRESLKKSLSDVLTEFYPLAGRLCIERSSLDCNDLGALFVESKVEGNLADVIKDPSVEELEKYLPPVEPSTVLLAVQMNLFDCGGIAVAVQMHHNAGDANSLETFMNAWAAATRGGGKTAETSFSPTYDIATLFPPTDDVFRPTTLPPWTGKFVTKRLLFDNKDLENLKLRASAGVIKDPTRVEAVTSFLLKHFRDACRARGSEKRMAVSHVVNLRPRMDPPLPSHAFGNAIYSTFGLLPGDDDEGDLVEVLRKVLRKIDRDFVREIQLQGDGYLNSLRDMVKSLEEETWFFTSWTRFSFYQVDFGWGSPKWVVPCPVPSSFNHATFITTSSGDGIEAWVNLLEQDAAFIDFSL